MAQPSSNSHLELAPWAVSPSDSLLTSRVHDEPPHSYRSPFQRDRDRVLHARAFRRLAGKTQVFTRRTTDHLRSRLTHTIEVTQIARTAAGALGLNEDLVETLALAHDIGHPPFGHAGERALDDALSEFGLKFDHNLHALRIVEHFEQRYAGFRGLNLTLAVREGIVKHSRDYAATEHPGLAAYFLDKRPPLEAQLIDLADEIAYLTADLDDGIESGVLELGAVRDNIPLLDSFYREAALQHPAAWDRLLFNEALKRTLNALVDDLVRTTASQIAEVKVESLDDVRAYPGRLVRLSPGMEAQRREAKEYLFAELYDSADLESEKEVARETVLGLFHHWLKDPGDLPRHQRTIGQEEGLPRAIADYIAGMTDQYALEGWAAIRDTNG